MANSVSRERHFAALWRFTESLEVASLADQELLARFLDQHDENAFQALLHRHGPMVLDVCRSLVPSSADAEDAFQATFLVLFLRARQIRSAGRLSSWLHGVAYRTALKARAACARRHQQESRAARPESTACEDLTWREVRELLHEEIARLPEKYRTVLLLCYLEGKTHGEASTQLGLAKGTLKGRLERARQMLRRRLVQRGLGLATTTLAAAWPEAARAGGLPPALTSRTMQLVTGAIASSSALPPVSSTVTILAREVIQAMLLGKIKQTAALVALVLCTFAVAGWLIQATGAQQPREGMGTPPRSVPPSPPASEPLPTVDPDLAGLQGSWNLVAEEHNEVKQPLGFKFYQLTFKGRSVTTAWVRDDNTVGGGTSSFVLDSTQNPRHLTITGDRIKIYAIYQLKKDRLLLAHYGKPESSRPNGFTSSEESRRDPTRAVLIVRTLERARERPFDPFTPPPAPENTPKRGQPSSAPSGVAPTPPASKVEQEADNPYAAWQGSWVLVKTEREGKVYHAGTDPFVQIVKGRKVALRKGSAVIWEAELTIVDRTAQPAQFNLKITSPHRLTDSPSYGIYEITTDTLKTRALASDTALDPDPATVVRPRDFDSRKGVAAVFYWKRKEAPSRSEKQPQPPRKDSRFPGLPPLTDPVAPSVEKDLFRTVGVKVGTTRGAELGSPTSGSGLRLVPRLQVLWVRPDSPAARAGLRKDDLVVGVHIWEAQTPAHLWYALTQARRETPSATRVKVQILREGTPIDLSLALPDDITPSGRAPTKP